MQAPATRTRRGGTIPLADAPGGGGASDEGPSDGPPRRRQRTLDSFLASSPARSTRSEISTRTERWTERRILKSELRGENGELLSSTGWVSEADCGACCPMRPLARGGWICSCTPVAQDALLSFPRWGRGKDMNQHDYKTSKYQARDDSPPPAPRRRDVEEERILRVRNISER